MKVFWLSFADADLPAGYQHLGCSVVEANDEREAIQAAWDQGCNPGGEVLLYGPVNLEELEESGLKPEHLNRLFTLADLNQLGIQVTGPPDGVIN